MKKRYLSLLIIPVIVAGIAVGATSSNSLTYADTNAAISTISSSNSTTISYSNDFSEDKGYIDPDNSWERNNNWSVTGAGGTANAAQSYYVSNTNDVFVDNGSLILRESANYHYAETIAILPDLSGLEGWDNNYTITVSFHFVDWNSSYSNANGTTGFNILTRLDADTSGNVFFSVKPPRASYTTPSLNIFGRRSTGAISGSYYSTNLDDGFDLFATNTMTVTVDGEGADTVITGSFGGQTISMTSADGNGMSSYYKSHAIGNRIAVSACSSTVAVQSIKVTSIDETITFYEYDFTNGDHESFWDGWSTYGMPATSHTDGSYYIKDGTLNMLAKQANFESFKNEVLYIPGTYKNFTMECDIAMTDCFEPEDGTHDKYFGIVFSGGTDLDKDAGKYGTFVFRKNGKIDLLLHTSSEARTWSTIKSSIRAAGTDVLTYGEYIHYSVSVIDYVLTLTVSSGDTTLVSYSNSFKGIKTTPIQFESGRIGFLANSTNVSIDNLVVYTY